MWVRFISLLYIFLIIVNGFNLLAQKAQVEISSIEDKDNKLIIKYDFVDTKESQHFNVSLEITSSTGQIIQANSLSGDLGTRISGGTGKQIIWDYTADAFVMRGNLNFEVVALPSGNSLIGKSLLLSAVYPGWGLNKIDKDKPYWLIGVAAYGCLGASVLLNKKANNNYTSYLENTDKNLNDELLSKSQSQNSLSKTLGFTALGIWGINLVWTAIKAKHTNPTDVGLLNLRNIELFTTYNPITRTKSFSLHYRF